MPNEQAIELLTRMRDLLLTSTIRKPYGYNSIWEWRKSMQEKIKYIKQKEKVQ